MSDILTTGLEVIHLTTHLVIFVTFKLSFTHLKLPLPPSPHPFLLLIWILHTDCFLYLIGTAILWREIKKLLFWPAMKKVHLQVIVKYFLLLWVKSFLKILCDQFSWAGHTTEMKCSYLNYFNRSSYAVLNIFL